MRELWFLEIRMFRGFTSLCIIPVAINDERVMVVAWRQRIPDLNL